MKEPIESLLLELGLRDRYGEGVYELELFRAEDCLNPWLNTIPTYTGSLGRFNTDDTPLVSGVIEYDTYSEELLFHNGETDEYAFSIHLRDTLKDRATLTAIVNTFKSLAY